VDATLTPLAFVTMSPGSLRGEVSWGERWFADARGGEGESLMRSIGCGNRLHWVDEGGQVVANVGGNSERRACSRVSPGANREHMVEIGGLNRAAKHPSVEPESADVDALADALLQVRSPSGH
jgi:hypothetical protein